MKYQEDLEIAKANKAENKQLVKKLKRFQERKLDEIFHNEHDKVFENIDCLECANCCSTTSPIFRDIDIKRLSKRLRVKPVQFIDEYLRVDEDDDYVLKSSPCPFLMDDNKCFVYEDRPRACRDYPHTDRKKMYQILPLTQKNTLVCPAVSRVMENIREGMNS
ncbi:YkgJ family cysteine cluster protein [Brumimicrobium aurantiacum]|uniref:YkgJ family cysteine cluster protein n=1 Tax=Brumimicrobium aurantiacum TaxID=1737063 RepID=A0A3E1EWN7_9FLAO|nr:YkgJ family cysteine cluster protein [Brumimicrobium aurantiacum]RFC53903.1 YkgJ family cysteine cluster protein [Brumimicrobium aurantiacum]